MHPALYVFYEILIGFLDIVLSLVYFVRLGPLFSLYNLKADLVALCDRDAWVQTSCVNKIILSVISSYKTKALGSVKELYCSGYHYDSSYFNRSIAAVYLNLLDVHHQSPLSFEAIPRLDRSQTFCSAIVDIYPGKYSSGIFPKYSRPFTKELFSDGAVPARSPRICKGSRGRSQVLDILFFSNDTIICFRIRFDRKHMLLKAIAITP
jgi:hypothetical protein